MRTLLFINCLILTISANLFAISYEELLDAARIADPELTSLTVAGQQADTAWERAVLVRDRIRLSLESGNAQATFSTRPETLFAPGFSATPSAALELPRGPGFKLETPITSTAEGTSFTPGLNIRLPLISRPDSAEITVREQALARHNAAQACRDRRILVEKNLVEQLLALFRAQASTGESRRKLLKAKVELARAVSVDGAFPGGKSYQERDRAVRIADRDVQRGESLYRKQLAALALVVGLPESAELVPARIPETDLSPELPSPAQCVAVALARATRELAGFRASEQAKKSALALNLGAGYGFDTRPAPAGKNGLSITSGLSANLEDLEMTGCLGWTETSGLGLQLSLAWKPLPPGDRELQDRAAALDRTSQDLAVDRALAAARSTLQSLDSRRRELLRTGDDLAEDLSWASGQLELYRAWKEKGVVTAIEVEEVEATVEAARAEAVLARLERRAWDLDRQMLVASAKEE